MLRRTMAGKHFVSANSRSFTFTLPSFVVIAVLSLLALVSVFFFSSSSSPASYIVSESPCHSLLASTHPTYRIPNPSVPSSEYSFVGSVEKFIASRSTASRNVDRATDEGVDMAAKALDDAIWRRETNEFLRDPPASSSAFSVVRVYVYEMPAKFTYDLLSLFRNTYKETPNLT